MNIADTLRGFLRRWYIVLPGIIIAMIGGVGAYVAVQPGYERTATQLLLPGEGTVPPGSTNPFLYLGGLTQAADIVVRVMQSEEVLGGIVADYPGTEIVVQRDPTVSGPVVQIVVTATSDDAAAGSLSALVAESAVVLDRLQVEQNVTEDDLMSITTLTQDTTSTLQQKTRLLIGVGTAFGLIVLTLLIASLVDGLSRRARRTGRSGVRKTATEVHDDDDEFDLDDLDADEPSAQQADDPLSDDLVPSAKDEESTANDDEIIDDEESAPEDDETREFESAAGGAQATRGRGQRGSTSRSR